MGGIFCGLFNMQVGVIDIGDSSLIFISIVGQFNEPSTKGENRTE